MNTSAVSKLLGVSSSTVGRWVKHLGLEMHRNEFGHYIYTDEDIEVLKDFKVQIQSGVPIQNIQVKKNTRRGSIMLQQTSNSDNNLVEKIIKLEGVLDNKADSVVSYQLLQHRRELEELKTQVDQLTILVEKLAASSNKEEETQQDVNEIPKRRKKNILRTILGF